MNENRMSRIAALRPASGLPRRPDSGQRSNVSRLLELLGGTFCTNPLGNHVAVRTSYPEPRACQIAPPALRLLLPNAPEEAVSPDRWLFLDTETTGLAGGTGTYAFLVGLAWWDAEGFKVEQFFMRDFGDEPSLLYEVSRLLSEKPVLVTFNGKSFDWPLLETRFRMARLPAARSPLAHIDLLHPARQVWRYRIGSVALSRLEREVLQLDRGYDIPSESIPGRFFDFVRGGPAEPVVEVFRHNAMDLRGLALLAAHIANLLETPADATREPAELYGMSRLLFRRGEPDLAGRVCELALTGGLGGAEERAAIRSLALAAKRQGDFEKANQLWRRIIGDSHEGLEASEHLAIYYEHQARDPEQAARLTRDALVTLREALNRGRIDSFTYRRRHVELQHRLDRLNRKLGN